MSLWGNAPISKPYVVDFNDGTEVRVDAYDIQEAMMAGAIKRCHEAGVESGPQVVGVRPDADKLKQRQLEDGAVARLLSSVLRGVDREGAPDPDKDDDEGQANDG